MNKKKYTTVSIDKETYDELRSYCNENAYSIAKFLRKLIMEKIYEKMPKPNK